MSTAERTIEELATQDYKYGFVTDIEADAAAARPERGRRPADLGRKGEPEWLLEWRLKAYRPWLTLKDPDWANVKHDPIDYQDIIYYSAPKPRKALEEPRRGRSRSPAHVREARHPARRAEGARPASPWTRSSTASRCDHVQGQAGRAGHHLLLVLRGGARAPRTWCGSTSARSCRYTDNFFAALNSAVFTDGSFCYIPKGVRCPMELSTYFRINAQNTGQFERTLIIADEGAT